ncbi:MAG: DNA-3-methyladenine glycosylase II [Microgenomates group bacterium Gr01-1014_5]|nr:MAG: DNA-3-methyladenine glycosylase II [Microgenomates group bacterium Gr01-1014_5]
MTKVLEHFKKNDPKLWKVAIKLGKIEPYRVRSSGDYFADLCESIVNQQLSGRAAATIWERFIALLPQNKVTPANVLKVAGQQMRDAGMSWAKARYVKDLALKVKDKTVQLDQLDKLSDQEVTAELIKVKGIGVWTAEMFLMFTLARPDIFSHGDLGLHNAICNIYGLKNPTREQVETLSLRWSPYRSIACRILWKSLEKIDS